MKETGRNWTKSTQSHSSSHLPAQPLASRLAERQPRPRPRPPTSRLPGPAPCPARSRTAPKQLGAHVGEAASVSNAVFRPHLPVPPLSPHPGRSGPRAPPPPPPCPPQVRLPAAAAPEGGKERGRRRSAQYAPSSFATAATVSAEPRPPRAFLLVDAGAAGLAHWLSVLPVGGALRAVRGGGGGGPAWALCWGGRKAVAPCAGLGPAQSVGGVTAEWSESNVVTAAVRRGVTFVLSRTH